jgi:heterodisulfide reductase subunit C
MLIQLDGRPQFRSFRQAVIARSGQNLLACLQCGKCSGGCPVNTSGAVARGPRQVIGMILLGLEDAVFAAELPWYCVGCAICASRCPVRIDFSRVAAAVVEMADEAGRAPAVRDIHRWEEVFLASVKHNGRIRELRAILENNLRAGRPWADALLGLGLFARGLFAPQDVLAGAAPGQAAVDRIFANVRGLPAKDQGGEAHGGKVTA